MTRIQLRHDTATNWTTVNPILAEGEAGIETDTNKFKIGDGVTTWNNLNYQGGSGDLSNYYTKSETDTALNNKQDKFSATVPLVMQEPSEPASPAITTEDDGVTFTVDSGSGYNTIMLFEGGATTSDYNSTLQLQTTENGNGIIDRTKNVVYDFETTETTDFEFRWASDNYSDSLVVAPKILLGKNNGNNIFSPSFVIGYNFSTTTPYNLFLYIGEISGSVAGDSDLSGWTGTMYDCNTSPMGYIPLNYGQVNLLKARLYNDNGDMKLDITVSSVEESASTQTFTLGSYISTDINCAIFNTSQNVTYQGANFGIFDATTGTQKWNPAKENTSRSLLLNINNSLVIDNNALGVNSSNYYTKSEVDAEVSNKADEDLNNITSIAPVLGMLQNADSSQVGYIMSVFISKASVYAPSGGKWLVLKNDQTVLNTAQIYELGGVIGASVGQIVNGGDLIADYTTQAQQLNVGLNVTLLKVQ